MSHTPTDDELRPLLEQLTLEEKVLILTGRDFWSTWPIERIGLRSMLFSDGPSGVRGEKWDERYPSLNFPSGTALAASWDTTLARRYGAASAVEARRKGVDVVLGPTINLHRSPLGGRHFEAFSEDPVLTADLAAAYVSGVQENGVGATPKHYVANDSETDRFTVNAVVGDRALYELYLLAFEKAVTESHAWMVMSSYNSINGVTATENDLLETPLNSEWGFDGVVVSDWTAVRSVDSARASQDLVMPGPDGPWGATLVDAVRSGLIPEAAVDRKVLRMLRLAARVGALAGYDQRPLALVEDGVHFAREASSAGMVLLRNTGELPWAASTLGSLAVVGDNARNARTQGGGSATVLPERVVTPLDGIREALPGTRVEYAVGAIVQQGIVEFPLSAMRNPATGEPGLRARFLGADDEELFVEDRRSANLVWFGGDAPVGATSTLELVTEFTPAETGDALIGFSGTGAAQLWVNEELVLDVSLTAEKEDLGASLLEPPSSSAPVALTAGVPVTVRVRYAPPANLPMPFMACVLGLEADRSRDEELIAEAVEAARGAEAALVVVGTNSRVESEGFDRTGLALPGLQDRLVSAVAAVNPRTVVVVNSGSPVLMPWREEVAAVLIGWFGGQEFGSALADVLTGATEPGGRLPTTWPAALDDVPVLDVTPTDGELHYDEGIHIGYRAWLKADREPAYPFGHGLGYTTWELGYVDVPSLTVGGTDIEVVAAVTNTGTRVGKTVVQVYLERRASAVDRPHRWLAGFAPVTAAPGETTTPVIRVDARRFAHWAGEWQVEPGEFTIRVGFSVEDLPGSAAVEVLGRP